MKVAIDLSLVVKHKRVSIGVIEMEVTLKRALEVAMEHSANLTKQEIHVRDLILHGLAHKEIAERMNLSERTVKFHACSVYRKYNVRDRAALVYALSAGKQKQVEG